MSRLMIAVVVPMLGISGVCSPSPKPDAFSSKSFGDGGGYKHPDAEVGGFLEAAPAGGRPAPARPVKVKAREEESLDSASENARLDYEARLFGTLTQKRRPGLASAPSIPPVTEPRAAESGTSEARGLFVSLDLDPGEASSLHDAVAGLGAATAFRPDARFQPQPGAGGAVRVTGWLPASRLGDVIVHPGIRRIIVEGGSRRAPTSALSGDFLIGLRLADAVRDSESVSAGIRELAEQANFTASQDYKLRQAFDIETAQDGSRIAIVAGRLPLTSLARVMRLSRVARVEALIVNEAHSPLRTSTQQSPPSAKVGGFVGFIMERGLWLVLVTLLLALPAVGSALKKGLAVFVPYR